MFDSLIYERFILFMDFNWLYRGKKFSISVVISKNLLTLSFIQGIFDTNDQLCSLIYCSNAWSNEDFKSRTFIRFVGSCDHHIIVQWSEVPIRAIWVVVDNFFNICEIEVKNCRVSWRFINNLFQMALAAYSLHTKAISCSVKVTCSSNWRIWTFFAFNMS